MRVGVGPFLTAPSGLAVGALDTALGLTRAGVEVTLFADADIDLPPHAASLSDRMVRLERLPAAMRHPRIGDAMFLATRMAISRRLGDALSEHPVDLFHSFSPGCLARIPRPLPTVTQAWFCPPLLGPRLRTMLPFKQRFPPLFAAHFLLEVQGHTSDLLGYRRADLVLANTPTMEKALQRRGFRAACVPACIEVPTSLPVREPSDALRIAFCGHPMGRRRKGLRYLLEALTLVRERPIEVTLVGGATKDLHEPIARARRAGVSVQLLGYVPREQYLEHLARHTDLLAFMSLYEEWGYALFEALSRGVPVLAFDHYPFFDILDEDTGMLVESRNAAAVAAAIDAACGGELPAPERALESTRRRFSNEAVVPRLISEYERLLT